MMNEAERNKAFPIHIDLGRKMNEASMPMSDGSSSKGKKGRPKIFYPTLWVDGVEGLEKLPKEGCILVDFRRKRLSLEEDGDGKERAGVTLEIRGLCLPEDMDAEESGDTMEAAFDRVAKGEEDEGSEEEDEEYEEDEE